MSETSGDRYKGKKADRKYSVSANRGHSRHRIRYVETGGASTDTEECVFCQSVPEAEEAETEEKVPKREQ